MIQLNDHMHSKDLKKEKIKCFCKYFFTHNMFKAERKKLFSLLVSFVIFQLLIFTLENISFKLEEQFLNGRVLFFLTSFIYFFFMFFVLYTSYFYIFKSFFEEQYKEKILSQKYTHLKERFEK